MIDKKRILEPIGSTIKNIKDLVAKNKFREAYALLETLEQPEGWVKATPPEESLSGIGFLYNDFYVIDTAANEIFEVLRWTIKSNLIHQFKEKFSSTTVVQLSYGWEGCELMTSEGIASSPCEGIEKLSLVVPLSLTYAKKSAYRQICKLFGSELNKEIEDRPLTLPTDSNKASNPNISNRLPDATKK